MIDLKIALYERARLSQDIRRVVAGVRSSGGEGSNWWKKRNAVLAGLRAALEAVGLELDRIISERCE